MLGWVTDCAGLVPVPDLVGVLHLGIDGYTVGGSSSRAMSGWKVSRSSVQSAWTGGPTRCRCRIEPQSPQKHCMVRTKRSPTTPKPRLETWCAMGSARRVQPHVAQTSRPVGLRRGRPQPLRPAGLPTSQSEQRPHQHLNMHIARFVARRGLSHAGCADEHVRRLGGDTTQPAGGVVRPIGTA